jgi:predicted GIY-YIG superfamily endonuclease
MALLKLKSLILEDFLSLKACKIDEFEGVEIEVLNELLEINFDFVNIKSSGVYKINFNDGFFYIGKSINIVRRIWGHLQESKIGDKPLYIKLKNYDKSKIFISKLTNNLNDEKKIIQKQSSKFMLNIMWNKFSQHNAEK